MAVKPRVPYSQIDPGIRRLVRALNAFPGIRTLGSCGGHPNPTGGQEPEGSWFISFEVEHSEDGWVSLEFLVYVVNNDLRRSDRQVTLLPYSAPPYLNTPGQMLTFIFQGEGEDPDAQATYLNLRRREHFISAGEVAAFLADDAEE